MDIVADIKNRVNIEDLVGQYVELKKTGKNFKGLCPFHNEKTPSFIVSPEKQIAYCFGCNKGGDIFKFLEEVEGITFQETITILAEKAGLSISDYAFKKSGPKKEEKETMIEAMSCATSFYQENLKSDSGKEIFKYLKGRGLNDETIEFFELGYAPDSFEKTFSHLAKKGFSDTVLSKVGLRSVSSDSKKAYDKFRGRVIFPVKDHLGRVIAFGGRAFKEGDEPKYLNSPETPLYHKSNVLYGLFNGKSAIKEKDFAIVVEGYMDVLMCSQAGYKNVVASSGTALAMPQLKLLSRYTKTLYFAFDMDNAGFEATKRAYLLALDMDMSVKVVTTAYKDPADCIQDDPKKFSKALEEAKPFMEFYFDKMFERFDVATIDGKRSVFKEVLPFLKSITNKVQQDFYVRDFAKRVSMRESHVYDELSRLNLPSSHPSKSLSKAIKTEVSIADLLLGFLLQNPVFHDEFKELLSENDFSGLSKDVYKIFIANYNAVRREKDVFLKNAGLSEEESHHVNVLCLYVEAQYDDFPEENLKQEIKVLVERVVNGRRERNKIALQEEIAEAEKSGNKEKYIKLLSELQEILK